MKSWAMQPGDRTLPAQGLLPFVQVRARSPAPVIQKHPVLDAAGGRAGRDDGLARVADSNPEWIDVALAMFPWFFGEWRETFDPLAEDWRAWMLTHGLWEPGHFNAWGALTGQARRLRLIEPTGERRAQRHRDGHAHKLPAYRWARGQL
jgi:hypothetical protein